MSNVRRQRIGGPLINGSVPEIMDRRTDLGNHGPPDRYAKLCIAGSVRGGSCKFCVPESVFRLGGERMSQSRQPEICSMCGQPIVPPVPDLTPIKQRILNIVKRRPGISAEELRSLVWDDPSGGPECRHTIFVHISQLNRALALHGLTMRSEGRGYRIRAVS